MEVEQEAVHLSLCKQHTSTQLLSQYITSNKHSTVSRARASQPALKLIKRRWQTSMFGKDGITSVDTRVGVDDCFFFFVCFFLSVGLNRNSLPGEKLSAMQNGWRSGALDLRCGGAHFRAMLHE